MKFGDQLRGARETLGLSVADVAARTKIRGEYLNALEEGDMGRLPERTIVRSYLQRYARELGLDSTPLMADFDRLMPQSPEIAQAMRGQLRARRGPSLPVGLIAALLSGVLLLGAAGWFGYSLLRARSTPNEAAAPTIVPLASNRQVKLSVASTPAGARVYLDNRYLGQTPISAFPVDSSDRAELRVERGGYQTLRQSLRVNADRNLTVQLAKPGSTPVVLDGNRAVTPPAAGQAAPKPGTPAVSGSSVSGASVSAGSTTPASGTVLRFVGNSWVRVRNAAGQTVYEGYPKPGTERRLAPGDTVRAGSAGAIQVSVNGAPATPLGAAGQVVNRKF